MRVIDSQAAAAEEWTEHRWEIEFSKVHWQLNAKDVGQMQELMPGEIKEDADVLRQGLAIGALSIPRAITWADRIIATSAVGEVPAPIYEVALGASRPVSDLIEQLSALGGSADAVVVSRRLLGVFAHWQETHTGQGARVAHWILTLAHLGYLPEVEFGAAPFYLDDFFVEPDLFEPSAGEAELASFLRQYALPAGV